MQYVEKRFSQYVFCLLVLSQCIGAIGCMMNNEASLFMATPQRTVNLQITPRGFILLVNEFVYWKHTKHLTKFVINGSGAANRIVLLFSCPGENDVCFIVV